MITLEALSSIKGSLPNVFVRHKETGDQAVFISVHWDQDLMLLGPIEGRADRDYFEKTWTITKDGLVENYIISNPASGLPRV
jgi:hypothetical protein